MYLIQGQAKNNTTEIIIQLGAIMTLEEARNRSFRVRNNM